MAQESIVWLDHREARIFSIRGDAFVESTVDAPTRSPRAGGLAGPHSEDIEHFFAAITRALQDSQAVVVVGPGPAKLHFLKYAFAQGSELAHKIIGVETVDQPSNRQILLYAKTYFLSRKR